MSHKLKLPRKRSPSETAEETKDRLVSDNQCKNELLKVANQKLRQCTQAIQNYQGLGTDPDGLQSLRDKQGKLQEFIRRLQDQEEKVNIYEDEME